MGHGNTQDCLVPTKVTFPFQGAPEPDTTKEPRQKKARLENTSSRIETDIELVDFDAGTDVSAVLVRRLEPAPTAGSGEMKATHTSVMGDPQDNENIATRSSHDQAFTLVTPTMIPAAAGWKHLTVVQGLTILQEEETLCA